MGERIAEERVQPLGVFENERCEVQAGRPQGRRHRSRRLLAQPADFLAGAKHNATIRIHAGTDFIRPSFSIMGTMIASPAQPEFDELATSLAADGAARSQMMGRPMLAIGGKMFACLDGPVLAVKLGRSTAEFEEALDLPGASVFSPGQGKRSFHDWVALPLDAIDEWERFARAAMGFSAAGPAKR
ncbi:hypothetical protein ACFFGH_12000 [Lysobacter korlensis]|uniref:TfoX N-terminal domain-containing protein n=1 Tax=Lysobacter korlensis TaxID=553636 RepID=A0ABV6RNJ5_9GAMM